MPLFDLSSDLSLTTTRSVDKRCDLSQSITLDVIRTLSLLGVPNETE